MNYSTILFISVVFKKKIKPRFLSTKPPFKFVNSKRLLCSQKAGVKAFWYTKLFSLYIDVANNIKNHAIMHSSLYQRLEKREINVNDN